MEKKFVYQKIYFMMKFLLINKIEYYRNKLLENNNGKWCKMANIVIFNPKSKLGVKKIEKLNNIDRKIPFFTSGKKTFYVNDWLVNGENIFMNDGNVADFKFYDGPAHYSDHVISFKSKDTNIVLNKFIFYSLMNQKK